ncbi:hypothetical protein ACP4OV_010887 [Aristida adscensionis]
MASYWRPSVSGFRKLCPQATSYRWPSASGVRKLGSPSASYRRPSSASGVHKLGRSALHQRPAGGLPQLPAHLSGYPVAGSSAGGALQQQLPPCPVCSFGLARVVDEPVRHACVCLDCIAAQFACPVCSGIVVPPAAHR